MATLTAWANSYAADGSLTAWTNPGNAYSDNDTYATRSGTVKNTWYGNLFGFNLSSLPDGAIITTITITAQWKNSANDSAGPEFFLGAKSGGSEVGSGTTDTTGQTTEETVTYQPTGLTAANLKATEGNGFWAIARFRRTDNTAHTASLDYIKIDIEYSLPVSGAATLTIDAISISGVGGVVVTGAGSPSLANATLSAAGEVSGEAPVPVIGLLSASIDQVTVTCAGKVNLTGIGQPLLSGIALSSTGGVKITGVMAESLAGVELSSGGKVIVSTETDVVLAAVTLSATGVISSPEPGSVTGALDQQLEGFALLGVGKIELKGNLSGIVYNPSLESDGKIIIIGLVTGSMADNNVESRGFVITALYAEILSMKACVNRSVITSTVMGASIDLSVRMNQVVTKQYDELEKK